MRLSLLAGLLAISSATAFGQIAEFSFSGGANNLSGSEVGSFEGQDYSLEGGFRFGFRVTLNNWRHFGHEFGYAYNRMKLRIRQQGQTLGEQGTAGHQGLYHFLAYATPEGSRVRPFAAGGAHFTNYMWPGYSVTYGGGSTKFGLNYGGGVKVRVTTNWLARVDVKQYWNGKPFDLPGASGSLKQNEITVGLAFAL